MNEPEMRQQIAQGVADSFDTVYCFGACRTPAGPAERRKSRGEARQEERDECCVYVCARCGAVCDEIPF